MCYFAKPINRIIARLHYRIQRLICTLVRSQVRCNCCRRRPWRPVRGHPSSGKGSEGEGLREEETSRKTGSLRRILPCKGGNGQTASSRQMHRSEERRVGKECRSRWS